MEKKMLILIVTTVFLTACNINKKTAPESKTFELQEVTIKDFDADGILDSLLVYDISVYNEFYEEYEAEERMFVLKLSGKNFDSQELVTSYDDDYNIDVQYDQITLNFPYMGYAPYNTVSLRYEYNDGYNSVLLHSFTFCVIDMFYDCFKEFTGEYDYFLDEWDFTCSILGRYIEDDDRTSQFFFDDETTIDDEVFNEIFSHTIKQIGNAPKWNDGVEFAYRTVSILEDLVKEVQQEKYRKYYTSHNVKQGETLYGISREYGISIEDLVADNDLQDDILRAGATIRIPIYKSKTSNK